MARTAQIILDGATYTIRAFNIGELETIGKAGNDAWVVLKTALKRADPKVENADLIEPTPAELTAAFSTIMQLAGLQKPDASPPQGTEAPAAAVH